MTLFSEIGKTKLNQIKTHIKSQKTLNSQNNLKQNGIC